MIQLVKENVKRAQAKQKQYYDLRKKLPTAVAVKL